MPRAHNQRTFSLKTVIRRFLFLGILLGTLGLGAYTLIQKGSFLVPEKKQITEAKIIEAATQGDIPLEVPKDTAPDTQVKGLEYLSIHHDKKEWKILSAEASLYNAKKIVYARQVKSYIYTEKTDSQPAQTIEMSSRHAIYSTDSHDLKMIDDVIIQVENGFVIKTQQALYHTDTHSTVPSKKIIIPASSPVEGDMIYEGNHIHFTSRLGLEIDLITKTLLLKNVTIQMAQVKSDTATIYSDLAKITLKKDTRWILGHFWMKSKNQQVQLTQKSKTAELKATANQVQVELLSETPKTKSSQEQNPLRRIIAEGQFQMFQKDLKARAGKATFLALQKLVILEDHPEIEQTLDLVKGKRIVYYQEEDRIEVEEGHGFSNR
jgi:lipopolysaccharide export system protein LptA